MYSVSAECQLLGLVDFFLHYFNLSYIIEILCYFLGKEIDMREVETLRGSRLCSLEYSK